MQPVVSRPSRRDVLKTIGAVGALSLTGVGAAAAAKSSEKTFGEGHGIGAFLNERAAYKPSPVWSSGVVDATGQDTVEVVVGAMTNVEMPNAPFEELPVAFAPQAVAVSPGTTVRWVWPSYGAPVPPIPHDVVSLDGGVESLDSEMKMPGADYTYTFDEVGTTLYYCTPHGAPFPVHPHGQPPEARIYNEFGMRGAVLVVED
ncbi:plastocyanin/azurin family copper-binding protein [Halospeciosus flavus]|uniref:Plastocyanin/azurin family copper-binding protein n=1 Tax=Halospeciosus flavus TaxID=3032283 RepID=A0ABD5Z7U5_9EURY|nr:plastocyanin/azurin family copper-binding protein [Halospeciosus flavus]